MTNDDSNREFHDELLSAFLDGELSDNERARVEERLAVDPVARQVLEELRSVSAAVRGLPTQALGEDLRGTILERVNQESQLSPKEFVAPAAAASTASPNGRDHAPVVEESTSPSISLPPISLGRTRRGWVWAAVAVAAAIFIMVVQPDRPIDEGQPNVASRDLRRSESINERRAGGPPDLRSRTGAELVLLDDIKKDAPLGDVSKLEGGAGERQTIAATPALPSTSDFDMNRNDTGDLQGAALGSNLSDKTNAPAQPGVAGEKMAGDAKNAATPILLGAAEPPIEGLGGELNKAIADAKTKQLEGLATTAAAPPATSASGTVTEPSMARGTAKDFLDLDAVPVRGEVSNGSAAPPIASAGESNLGRDNVLVVHVSVKPAALAGRAFDQKLANRQIKFDAPEAASAVGSASKESGRADAPANRYFGNASELYDFYASPQAADAVLVDASPASIQQLIGDLDGDAENVIGITVDRLPNGADGRQVASVDWLRFKRVAMPQGLRESGMLLAQGNGQPARAADASGGESQISGAARRGGRGGRGGGGGGGGGFGGGGAAVGGGGGGRGATVGRGRGGRRAAMGADGAGAADQPTAPAQANSTPLPQNESKTDALIAADRFDPASGERKAAAAGGSSQAQPAEDAARFAKSERANEERAGNEQLSSQLAGGIPVESSGRARRLFSTTAPQIGQYYMDSNPLDELSRQTINRGAQTPSAATPAQPPSGRPATAGGTVATGQAAAAGKQQSTDEAEKLAESMSQRGGRTPLFQEGQNAGRELQETTAAKSESQALFGGVAAPPAPTMRVLFLFRAAPEPNAAGAITAPATSTPAADPAK